MISRTRATWNRRRTLSVACAVVATALLAAACDPAPPPPPTVYDAACNGTLVASTPGTIANAAVTELSGIAASRRNPGVWWAHNDSGSGVRNVVYAVGDDGRSLGNFTITNASNVDWEDIAVGPGPVAGTTYVYVGDIGNNISPARNAVAVYRFPEPAVSSSVSSGAVNVTAEKLTLTYPAGETPDAEALLVDPVSGELFVMTKELSGSRVFGAPANLASGTTTGLVDVASIATVAVTAADVTPNGEFVAVRTPFSVTILPRPSGQSLAAAFSQAPCTGASVDEGLNAEAIGFTPDGRGYVTASEGAHPPLHEFHAP